MVRRISLLDITCPAHHCMTNAFRVQNNYQFPKKRDKRETRLNNCHRLKYLPTTQPVGVGELAK
jgi:hypothetical protein